MPSTRSRRRISARAPRTRARQRRKSPHRRMAGTDRRIVCRARLAAPLLAATFLLGGAGDGGALAVDELAPGVYVHRGAQLPLDAPGHDDIANIGFIVGNRCVAVIDTGGSVRIGRALRAAVRRHTSLPICYVINTHVHVDHVLGSRAYFVKEYAQDLDVPATPEQVIGPDRLVQAELTLDLGGRSLTLHAWPTAHTDCDLTVYDQKTSTLWTGDLLFIERLPALDGNLVGWIAAIDRLATQRPKLAVP